MMFDRNSWITERYESELSGTSSALEVPQLRIENSIRWRRKGCDGPPDVNEATEKVRAVSANAVPGNITVDFSLTLIMYFRS